MKSFKEFLNESWGSIYKESDSLYDYVNDALNDLLEADTIPADVRQQIVKIKQEHKARYNNFRKNFNAHSNDIVSNAKKIAE